MTMTRTPAPERMAHRREPHTVLAAIVLVVLLAPVIYLFTRLWATTDGAATTTETERTAVAYARPVSTLLAALADAQAAAIRQAPVDVSRVRTAVDEVHAADRRSSDALQVRQRWTQLSHEIDNVLSQGPTGPAALDGYAAPIALTQALLDRIAIASRVTRDPGEGAYQLTQVALGNLPDVVVNAGQVSALAGLPAPATAPSGRAPSGTDTRLVVAADRLARAAAAVNTGLRASTGPGANEAVDLDLLGPLDEFSAAVDTLSQTANAGHPADQIDAANTRVKRTALALQSAVLDAFDTQLRTRADGYTGQQRVLVLAALIIVLAAAALLWLRVPAFVRWPVRRRADGIPGRHSQPAEEEPAEPGGAARIPDLVDARDLLAPPNGLRQEVTRLR